MSAAPEGRDYRGAILRPCGGAQVIIHRPGLALHHSSMSWSEAEKLIDWSIDTNNDMGRLPPPYTWIEVAVAPPARPSLQLEAARPAKPPPTPRAPREKFQRDANGRLAF